MLPLRWEHVFHFSWFLKKVAKNDANGKPKVMFFDEKLSLERLRVDLCSDLFDFRMIQEILGFRMAL